MSRSYYLVQIGLECVVGYFIFVLSSPDTVTVETPLLSYTVEGASVPIDPTGQQLAASLLLAVFFVLLFSSVGRFFWATLTR